jgi:hypothetical protein
MQETQVYRFSLSKKDDFLDKMAKLNKKLSKIGDYSVEIVKEELKKVEVVHKDNIYGDVLVRDILEVTVKLPTLPKSEYELIGTSENYKGSYSFQCSPEHLKDIEAKDHHKCEECGRSHKARKKTYYLKK